MGQGFGKKLVFKAISPIYDLSLNLNLGRMAWAGCLLILSQNLSLAQTPALSERDFPVNPQISPCDDFYAYACSKTIQGFQLRPDRAKHTFAFDDSQERLLERKKTFLKELEQKVRSGESLTLRSKTLGTVYGACMDEKAAAHEERRRVQETLLKLAKIKDRAQFLQFLADERALGKTSFLSIGNTAHQTDPLRYDFYFLVDAMTLPERSYYEREEIRQDYLRVLQEFFKTLNVTEPKGQSQKVFAFEEAFAQVNPLPGEWRKIWNKPSKIDKKDISKFYPSYEFERFFAKIPEGTHIRHFAPETHSWLQKKLSSGDLEELKAAYLWQALADELDDAYPEFFHSFYQFQVKHLGASVKRPDRDERCAKKVMAAFTKELDAELIPFVFPNFPEKEFIALAEKVREAIILGLEVNPWLSKEGRIGAQEKMAKARLQLVKPQNEEEWYFNPPIVARLDETKNNFDQLTQKLLEREFEELTKRRSPNVWSMGPLTVNAYYSASDNKFVMPLGILQPPFYDPKLPVATNLGAVGAVIGHELGHGIDDEGSRYDATGRLRPWMTPKDLEEFHKRGQVLVSQFNEIGHDGQLTLGENIGDLTGLTFAFRAAFPDPDKASIEAKKAFFLQYARVWCQVMLPAVKEKMLKTDPHALGVARVNQQVKNQPEFEKAFACKKTDKMVLPPEQRAIVW